MQKRGFGDLEQAILSLLRAGERTTVRKVQARLGGDDKYTTVMTVMNRLVDKKVLKRERIGLRYEYWLTQSRSFFDRLRKRLFGVKTMEVVSYLIEEAEDLTDEDLKAVERLIDARRKGGHE